ncbi:hypothetical protein [Mesorhizobium sp. CAU 1741]|uniref:hypothetical protein n=1 Tax=Mesorhizobium sp. CAU 1741 TaxID=3140366 RepID=UPI00325B07B6
MFISDLQSKVSMRVWVFLLKDSVPCPIPNFSKKMRVHAPSPNMTIRIAVGRSTEFKAPAPFLARYPKSVLHK